MRTLTQAALPFSSIEITGVITSVALFGEQLYDTERISVGALARGDTI